MSAQPAAAPSPADSVATFADAAGDEMPTFHTMQPVVGQESAPPAIDEMPTARGIPAQLTPAASEFANFAPPAAPQAFPGMPASPAPGFPLASGPLPIPQPGASGALYPQPGQGAIPGFPSGAQFPPVAPQSTPPPGYLQAMPQLVYPQATPLPGYPQVTPLPGFPLVQGQPSGEFPAGTFQLPGQQVSGTWGVYGAPGGIPTTPQVSQPAPSKLISPLPLWAFIGSIALVAVVLGALTFFAGHPLDGAPGVPDWAAGAQTAGIVALILGVLILIAFGVRSAVGLLAQTNPHRRKQLLSSLVLTLLLIAFGAVGLTAQTGIHNAQGHSLQGQGNWLAAIAEYKAGGQDAPSSEDLASTYVDWGKNLISTSDYSNGIAKFEVVTANYGQAANGFAQAKSQAIQAYMAWGNQAVQAQKYSDATQHYDKLLSATYCDSACQTPASAADATAYYKLAEQRLHQTPPDYPGSVAAFNQLTTRFGSSSSSQSAHADYASALWGDGQQLLTTTCASALTIYQQLSSQFSDTPQGQQATAALAQPAPVKGHFTSNIPSGAETPTVALMQGISAQMPTNQFYAILAKSPITSVQSDGTFTFKSIKQGSYYLSWGTINQSKGGAVFISSQLYPASVGPLCGFSFGDINESFPLA
ncbi:MAG TPA: hypothetical protein VF458_11620 [Ktedonobacteraceae bacterium]